MMEWGHEALVSDPQGRRISVYTLVYKNIGIHRMGINMFLKKASMAQNVHI